MRSTLALVLCVLVAQSNADSTQDLLKQLMKEKSPKEIDALMAGLSKPAAAPAPALPVKVVTTAVKAVAAVATAPIKVAAGIVKAVAAPVDKDGVSQIATTAAPVTHVAVTTKGAAAAPVAKPAAAVAKPAVVAAKAAAKPAAVPAKATKAATDEKELKDSISKLSSDDILATLNSVTTVAPAPVAKASKVDAKAKLKELLKQKTPDQLNALKQKLSKKAPAGPPNTHKAPAAPKKAAPKKHKAAPKIVVDMISPESSDDYEERMEMDGGYGEVRDLQMDPFNPTGGNNVVEMIEMDVNERGAPVVKIGQGSDPFSDEIAKMERDFQRKMDENPAGAVAGLMGGNQKHHQPKSDGMGGRLSDYPMQGVEDIDDIAKDVQRKRAAKGADNYSSLHNMIMMGCGVGAIYLVLSGNAPITIPGFGNVHASQVYRRSTNKMEDIIDDFGLPMDSGSGRGSAKPLKSFAANDDYGGLL